jgi:hypothetical protein
MAPKLYTQQQYDNVAELVVRANARMIQMHDAIAQLRQQLQTMQAKQKRPVEVFATFEPPADLLQQVVNEQKRRGLRL